MKPRKKHAEGHKESERLKLSAKESLKRLQQFSKRKEQLVATVRKGSH